MTSDLPTHPGFWVAVVSYVVIVWQVRSVGIPEKVI
jgi:hypothetical protein